MYYNKFLSFFSSKNISIPKKVLRNYTSTAVRPVKTHKNDVKLVYFSKDKFYTKFSTSKRAITKIDSELQGLRWYCKRIGVKKKIYYKKLL